MYKSNKLWKLVNVASRPHRVSLDPVESQDLDHSFICRTLFSIYLETVPVLYCSEYLSNLKAAYQKDLELRYKQSHHEVSCNRSSYLQGGQKRTKTYGMDFRKT